MAKIKLENTSDAAIYLPIVDLDPQKKPVYSGKFVTVPRQKKEELTDEVTGDKRTRTTFGAAEIDDAQWERLKQDKVIATYLSSGRLRVAGSAGPPPAASPPVGGKAQR